MPSFKAASPCRHVREMRGKTSARGLLGPARWGTWSGWARCLLDEPLSALDAKVALAVADRVGVMSQGRLEQLAAPADLYADPASPFVAEFVGLNNKVPVQVSGLVVAA